jgi:hypothetical protein
MDTDTQIDIIVTTLLARLVELHGHERAAELLVQLAASMRASEGCELTGRVSRH